MSPRDVGRAQMYAAERLVFRMFERAGSARTVQIAGTELTLPTEALFGSVDSVRDYVSRVVSMPAVLERFPRSGVPVAVRSRGGFRSAEYRRVGGHAEIAIPDTREGRWALRELVVLHELAHHLDDGDGPAHGRGFVLTLTELVGTVLGPEAGFVYRVILAESGVR
ncbi:TIGR04338 family metallohydrolase [Gordonia sp. NB41Y]|uniref:TIGR04338 family metallohydrolase n=1 Tax=Gordonia sp. NB41Y TaxID=875808 RepID=UPI00273AB0CA|nr:TIGR04338 family metallohydrolase [Gordonia sp. NB41Y]WLP92065.1 TIGR04338 family metallohydrolase [Gordonia sp. NB41Y]